MSYSLYWDCSLAISNIRDIVNINIIPVTSAVNEGDYISVKGHIAIEGEYVSLNNVQYLFGERLPLDITLPSDGCTGDIKVDVSNFDYTIHANNQLNLNLNLTIHGYDVVTDEKLEEAPARLDELKEKEVPKPVYVQTQVDQPIIKEVIKEVIVEKPVEVVKEVIVEKPVEVVKEVIVEKPVVTEVVKEVIVEKPVVTEVVKEVIVEKPVAPNPVTVHVQSPQVEATVTPEVDQVVVENVTVENVNIDNVFPFVSKPEIKQVVTPQDKSKIFDMLYELDKEEVVEEVVEVEEVIEHPVVAVEEVVEPKKETVYSHFSDGESLTKIVFIQEEVVTVEQICQKYDVGMNCIEGIDCCTDTVFHCNDRVMIRYDR